MIIKDSENTDMLTILGPTASGKTRLAVALAGKLNGAVISADSRQVFRGMDIGTGKDLDEYGEVPYHLINIRAPGEPYHVAAYREDFLKAYARVRASGRFPILCGGSGLYLQAALQGLPYAHVPVNPAQRKSLEQFSQDELLAMFRKLPSAYSPLADTSTRKRLIRAIEIATYLREHENSAGQIRNKQPGIRSRIIGIQLPVDIRRQRITRRLQERLSAGLIEEVRSLLAKGIPAESLLFYGLEYKFVVYYLQGRLNESEMQTRLNTAIHQFAKRQMTFFRKLEKDGHAIHWINGALSLKQQVAAVLTATLTSDGTGISENY